MANKRTRPQRRSTLSPPASETRRPASGAPALTGSSHGRRFLPGKNAWLCIALVALTVVVYLPVRHHGFVLLDDTLYVSENSHVAHGITWDAVSWAVTTGRAANWHPLTWLSHMLDVQLFGLEAGLHHVTSLVLHLLNVILLFVLLYRMTGARARSVIVAALFAVHPMHVESVAWIAERKDVLSAFFWMVTLLAYLAYVRKGGWLRFGLVIVAFAAGLMAKPMLVTLPFVLLLLDRWPLGRVQPSRDDAAKGWAARGRAWLPLVWEKGPLIMLAAVSSVITFEVQRHGGAMAGLQENGLGPRVATALVSYVAYIVKTIWPSGLSVFYPYPPTPPVWTALAALLLLIAVSAAILRSTHRLPCLAVGWFWYLITLVPVIGIVQVGRQAMADRYTYIPHIGLFIAVVWSVAELTTRPVTRRLVAGAACAAIVACAVVARAQVMTWQNSETLWRHALAVDPDDYLAHDGLGIVLRGQGHTTAAVDHFTQAIRIAPAYPDSYLNLGLALEVQGQTDAAIAQYRIALQLKPDYALAHINLGTLLLGHGDVDEGLLHCREALALDPDLRTAARVNIAKALAGRGRVEEAIAEYREALRLAPNDLQARMALGQALCGQGRMDEAVKEFQVAVRFAPASVDAHNNLGVALAAANRLDEAISEYGEALHLDARRADVRENLGSAQARKGSLQDAIAQFTEALRLDPDRPTLHDDLGFALAAQGRMSEAIPHFEQAVRLEPDSEVSHLYLAMALAGTGMAQRAAAEFREVLRINPRNEKALHDLAELERSRRAASKTAR